MAKMYFKSPDKQGFFAYIENDNLVIGEERGREGGILYRGEFLGMDTPYIKNLEKEDKRLFQKIWEHYILNTTFFNKNNDLYDVYSFVYKDTFVFGEGYVYIEGEKYRGSWKNFHMKDFFKAVAPEQYKKAVEYFGEE